MIDESGLVRGVAIIGRPCNTHLDDEWTLEVRCICTDRCPNACSALYAAAWKAAKAIGNIYAARGRRRFASCCRVEKVKGCGGKGWNSKGRARQENPLFLVKKSRWEIVTREYVSSVPGCLAAKSDAYGDPGRATSYDFGEPGEWS